MLKSHCLLSKIVMLFWDLSLSITLSYEFRCHSSQLKCLNGRQELGTWSSLSLSLSLVDPRDMLNKFLYAQKSLFIGENANANFFLPITPTSVSVTFEPIELVPS